MYTMEGARKLAVSKKKTCCFWTPVNLSSGTNHAWIYDPKGTIKEYSKKSKHSEHMIINKHGEIIGGTIGTDSIYDDAAKYGVP